MIFRIRLDFTLKMIQEKIAAAGKMKYLNFNELKQPNTSLISH